MSKKINKLNAISLILMALFAQNAQASSYAEDQSQSMTGRASMNGGSLLQNSGGAENSAKAEDLQHLYLIKEQFHCQLTVRK